MGGAPPHAPPCTRPRLFGGSGLSCLQLVLSCPLACDSGPRPSERSGPTALRQSLPGPGLAAEEWPVWS